MDTVDRLVEAREQIDAAIFELTPPPEPPDPTFAPWMDVAREELGVKEVGGAGNSTRVLEYLDTTTLGAWAKGRDATPWCSAFVNWVLQQVNVEGTDSAAARSWLGWGVDIEEPRTGCIVVLKRGSNPRAGHVGFFERAEGDHLYLLGGNQQNSVSVQPYPIRRLLSYRWPA